VAFDLRNQSGSTIRVRGGHWAVFLSLAEAFGWKPAGTRPPSGFPVDEGWHGRYDSNDGQIVTQEDAISLAKHLHGAAVSPDLNRALADVIRHIEAAVEREGMAIPAALRMTSGQFHPAFSPLLLFLYEGEFIID
jgi:hypothetical protein